MALALDQGVLTAWQPETSSSDAGVGVARRMASGAFRKEQERDRYAPHVRTINELVDDLRDQDGRGWMPYAAPWHGGVEARVLSVLRDPGPKTQDTVGSGFLCVENDDPTAERQCHTSLKRVSTSATSHRGTPTPGTSTEDQGRPSVKPASVRYCVSSNCCRASVSSCCKAVMPTTPGSGYSHATPRSFRSSRSRL